MSEYKLKTGKIGKKVTETAKDVEERFTDKFLEKDEKSPTGYSLKTGGMAERVMAAYQKIEDTVVGGYQKIEDTVVDGYKKIENGFVDKFLEKEESGDEPENTEAE